jgi:hypothetical protein
VEIVRTSTFLRAVRRIGLQEAEVLAIEDAIAANPEAGDLIQGSGGARKLRFGMAGRGKSYGGRAIYFVVTADGVAYLLTAYAKTAKADLTPDDRKVLKTLIKELSRG